MKKWFRIFFLSIGLNFTQIFSENSGRKLLFSQVGEKFQEVENIERLRRDFLESTAQKLLSEQSSLDIQCICADLKKNLRRDQANEVVLTTVAIIQDSYKPTFCQMVYRKFLNHQKEQEKVKAQSHDLLTSIMKITQEEGWQIGSLTDRTSGVFISPRTPVQNKEMKKKSRKDTLRRISIE